MALPVVNTPKYDVELPSGKTITIRPFLVKEQKLVLNAIEMRDPTQLNHALHDILKSCTLGKVDIDELTVYDVEYLIMQIRARSVGEIVDVNYICNHHIEDKLLNAEALKINPDLEEKRGHGICETKIPLKINIGQLTCTNEKRPDNRIMFTDTIGVVVSDMKYGVYSKLEDRSSKADLSLHAIASCIDMVIDGDVVLTRNDFTVDQIAEWLDELTGDDFDMISDYIKSMPTMKMEMKLVCPCCGASEDIKLEGLDDFLA